MSPRIMHKNFNKYSCLNSNYNCVKFLNWEINILWYWWHSFNVIDIWFLKETMGFTVQDRYLPLPTWRTLEVLHLGKRESHRERGPSTRRTTYLWLQSTELSSTICKWSACWCCPPPGRPSRSIVPVLTIIFIRVFSPKVPLFLTKHLIAACCTILLQNRSTWWLN